jgi:Cdc6-like AAA superfamily ATPase
LATSAMLAPERAMELSLQAGTVFSPTAPIDERSLFAGRNEQVRKLIDAINQKGQHAILFGERGVGKTSLANVLASFLSGGPTVLSPRVNCDTMDTYSSIWRKVFAEIDMVHAVKAIGFAPGTQEKVVELLGGNEGVSPDDVRRALTFLSRNSLPILILDEFDRLRQDVKRGFADTIKTLSDHAVRATVLLVGVADSVDQLIEEHQSVERALVQVRMPRMSIDEIKQIINTGVARLEMMIDVAALERISLFSQGLPHYAHLLGLHTVRTALDDESSSHVKIATVDAATKKALQDAQQSVRSACHKATLSTRKDTLFSDVLLSCALAPQDSLGWFAAQDVRQPLREITGKQYDIPSFAQHLNEFSEPKRGPILEKTGARKRYRFRFINPLVQPFVIMQGFANGKLREDILVNLQKHAAKQSEGTLHF